MGEVTRKLRQGPMMRNCPLFLAKAQKDVDQGVLGLTGHVEAPVVAVASLFGLVTTVLRCWTVIAV